MKINLDNRDYRYIYFIENHINTSQINIKLVKEAGNLEIIHQDLYKNADKCYIINIFRFKIYPSKINLDKYKKYQVDIILKDAKTNEFKTTITIDNLKIDSFIFDFKFDIIKGWVFNVEPPESFSFNLIQQFEIYLFYLRKILKKKQQDLDNEYFILSVQKLLIGENNKYQFSFYIYIFLECFATPLVQRHLSCFKPEKITSPGTISKDKILKITNILGTFEKKPEKVLDNIKNKASVPEYGVKLFTVILYFNYVFHNERMNELLTNEENKLYIYEGLLNYGKLFKNLELNKEQITFLLQLSCDFNQMKISLKFTKSVCILLELIIDNYQKFYDFYKEEEIIYKKNLNYGIKSKIPKIDVEEIATPDKNDNMKKIAKLYKNLIAFQQGYLFITFYESFFEKYIICFNKVNLENLFYMKDIINYTKKNINKFKLKNIEIEKTIHENGLYFAKKGELIK